MLDIKLIRSNPALIIDKLSKEECVLMLKYSPILIQKEKLLWLEPKFTGRAKGHIWKNWSVDQTRLFRR